MNCFFAMVGLLLFATLFVENADAGTLRVRINPEDVRDEASWRLYEYDGSGDRNDPGNYDFLAGPFEHNHVEGRSRQNYLNGRYMVVFSEVSGWDKPDSIINIRVGKNDSKGINREYTQTSPTTTTTTTTTTTIPTTTTTTTTSSTTTTSTTTSSTSTTTTTASTTSTTTTTLPGGLCLDISDVPLDTQLQPAPASIMFVIDDSGSMDFEILIQGSGDNGMYKIGSYYYAFLYDMSDNINGYYTSSIKNHWKTQWCGYNRMFYDPNATYDPWPQHAHGNASTTAPRSNPENSSPTLTLANTYYTVDASGGTTITVDDEDGLPEFNQNPDGNGIWNDYYSAGYSSSVHYTSSSPRKAKYTPDLPETGTYEVSAYWHNTNSLKDGNAKYTIVHKNGTSTEYMDQEIGHGQFNRIGEYEFNAGTGGSVTVERHSGSTRDITIADAVRFVLTSGGGTPAVDIKNAHYFTYYDADEDGVLDSGESVFLVNFEGGVRKFYEYTDDGDNLLEPGELQAVFSESNLPDAVKPRAGSDDLQNWANWFTYYRKRELTAKNAIGNVVDGLSGVRVGFHGINGGIKEALRPVNLTMSGTTTDDTTYLLGKLYALNSYGGTPLRSGLKTVGDYFDGTASYPYNTSPYYSEPDGGACQQSFAIAMTDGYWNSDSTLSVGNQDGGLGNPYQDSVSNTLADVAMKYYKNDLVADGPDLDTDDDLPNLVPTNFPDTATWQHMVTYGVSFGMTGTENPENYDFYKTPADTISWPTPSANGPTTIDDLWHATVNGRGQFLSAGNPEELTSALLLLMQNIESRIGSGASVSINGEEVSAESIVFQSSYKSDDWSGDVKAYRIDASSGAVVSDTYVWSAQGQLQSRNWDTGREIGTYDGATGVAFRYDDLSATQKSQLYESQVNFIRGDATFEGTAFRDRNYKLGDIVHSIPVFHKNYIYAGGNDGMLHVFDASDGEEVFAYVPNLVFPNLYHLTLAAYNHKYFIDKSPYVKDTGTDDLMVCGLGGGGKGYFCLDVTDPSANTEANVSSWAKWEYPRIGTPSADIDDLGDSFSRAFIVDSYRSSGSGTDNWITVFGNGYNSVNGHAVLFILDAYSGSLIRKIDVGGTCNGLSTPVPIDVDNDDKVDYVYAGDLNGNMWKFDLTDTNTGNWDVAYKSGTTSKPLFTAKDGSGTAQPITIKPDVMRHCDKSGYMVLFGTGQYLGDPDFVDTNTQTIYGIWDYGDDADNSEYLGAFNRGSTPQLSNQPNTVSLLEQTEIFFGQDPGGATTYDLRVLSDHEPSWVTVPDRNSSGTRWDPSNTVANHAGWYFDLPISKERVIRNVIIRDGKLIVVSSIPKSSPCAAGGDSILHEMDACTGGRLTEAQFDINDDGVIDENDMITIDDPDSDDPDGHDYGSPHGYQISSHDIRADYLKG